MEVPHYSNFGKPICCDDLRRTKRAPPAADHCYKFTRKHRTAPPCLGEAMRWGDIIKLLGLMIFRLGEDHSYSCPVQMGLKIRKWKSGIHFLNTKNPWHAHRSSIRELFFGTCRFLFCHLPGKMVSKNPDRDIH